MTGLTAIDESGDLGSSGSKFFAVAAIVMFSPRYLKKVAKSLPTESERKWHNTLPEKREELFISMSKLKFNVVYSVIDKNHPDNKCPIYGKKLYEKLLTEVISDAMSVLPCKDTNVLLDGSGFIKMEHFRQIVSKSATMYGIDTKIVHKVSSDANKCIQLADFIAGASRSKYEFSDTTLNIINEKISVARRH